MPPQPAKDSSKSKAKQIRDPRRLLILSPSSQSQLLVPSLLRQLTGYSPSETQIQTQSFAGYTTHPPLRIENRYYAADVPVWVDEIPVFTTEVKADGEEVFKPESTEETLIFGAEHGSKGGQGRKEDTCAQWSQEFSSSEARVVRDAIGAVMICLQNPRPNVKLRALTSSGKDSGAGISGDDEHSDEVRGLKAFVRAVGTVRALIEEERGEIGSVPGLLVLGGKEKKENEKLQTGGMVGDPLGSDSDLDAGPDGAHDDPFSIGWWEDQLCEMGLIGFEVVEWDWTRDQDTEERNQYGELQGMRRVKEVLETHEWARDEEENTGFAVGDADLERELLGLDEEGSGFNNEVDELEREMVGLRFAIGRGGDTNVNEDDEGDEELRVDAVEALLTRMRAIKGGSLLDLL
ncbi:hypothetical protein BDW66DRAFT_118003 [Aspergillus desertorum]